MPRIAMALTSKFLSVVLFSYIIKSILSPYPCHGAVLRSAALATECQVSIKYGRGSTFDLRQNKALGTPHKGFTRDWKIKMIFRWWSRGHCSEQLWCNRLWMGYQECVYRFCSSLAMSTNFLKGKRYVGSVILISRWTSGTDIISSSISSSWIWCVFVFFSNLDNPY